MAELTVLKKYQPVVRLSDGKLYRKANESDGKHAVDSVRLFIRPEDPKGKVKLEWYIPIPAVETYPLFDGKTGPDLENKPPDVPVDR